MADITAGKEAEDRVAVASNWRLVWWRFRRHHLAMASGVLLIFLYLIVLVPDFFSTQDPERTDARQAFIPVQMVHFFDDGSAVALGARHRRQAQSRRPCAWNGRPTPTKKVPVRFFARGYTWQLLRPVPHQPAPDRAGRSRRSASSCWAPTGSAAISGRASCTARRPR